MGFAGDLEEWQRLLGARSRRGYRDHVGLALTIYAASGRNGDMKAHCSCGWVVLFITVVLSTSAGLLLGASFQPFDTVKGYETIPGAWELAFDGENIWVSSTEHPYVAKHRASDGALLDEFRVLGIHDFALAYDGRNMWVGSDGTDTLTRLRASNGALVDILTTSDDPQGLVFDGTSMWVSNRTRGWVSKLRRKDGRPIERIDLNGGPGPMVFDGANIWVVLTFGGPDQGGNAVAKLSLDAQLIGKYPVGAYPYFIASDGANIYVSNSFGETITKLRAIDGVLLNTFHIEGNPEGIAYGAGSLWVATELDNQLTRLNPEDGTVEETFHVPELPFDVLFDGVGIWVASSRGRLTNIIPSP